jgi:hypothetical protein
MLTAAANTPAQLSVGLMGVCWHHQQSGSAESRLVISVKTWWEVLQPVTSGSGLAKYELTCFFKIQVYQKPAMAICLPIAFLLQE